MFTTAHVVEPVVDLYIIHVVARNAHASFCRFLLTEIGSETCRQLVNGLKPSDARRLLARRIGSWKGKPQTPRNGTSDLGLRSAGVAEKSLHEVHNYAA